MNISSSPSYIANVATRLQQLKDLRQQQIQVDLEAGDTIRSARQQAVDQSMQDSNKQAEQVNEIKSAGLQARSGGGSIDAWA